MLADKEENLSLSDRLTRQFYDWEIRGRGWWQWDGAVELEPPFRPFTRTLAPRSSASFSDSGVRPTFLSTLADRAAGFFSRQVREAAIEVADDPEAEHPRYFQDRDTLCELQIALPPQTNVPKAVAGQLLASLGPTTRPISFELIGSEREVVVQIACASSNARHIREQIRAFFPDAVISDQPGYLRQLWNTDDENEMAAAELGLTSEFMRPFNCFDQFDPDPLAGVVAALGALDTGEVAILQILFCPTRRPWAESILRAVSIGREDFFADDAAMAPLARRKISAPLYAVAIRIGSCSPRAGAAARNATSLFRSLGPLSDPMSNELVPLDSSEDFRARLEFDILTRTSRRSGAILNLDELVSLVHLPSQSVRSDRLKRQELKTRLAPPPSSASRLMLGYNEHQGVRKPVNLSVEQRLRHTYLIGASGTGKSSLLLNMIRQDLEAGEGIAVLDPHGDLIDNILARIPDERLKDVVLFDPSDAEYPIGFNILSALSELERTLLASDLVAVFRRMSTSWGDQMNSVFANAILAFLESSEGGTLLDLRRFLVEAEFRNRFLGTVGDPEIVYFWQKEFPLLRGKPQGPILTRLDAFLRPKLIRNMVSQKENRLDLKAILEGRKILLAKLSQGLIGEENSYLLGALLVAQMNQAAMSRQAIRSAARTPFYLYIDEFHNFVTPSLSAILSGARKYQLGLILAHQELAQLGNRENEISSAVLSNPCTRICFRVGDADAKRLEAGFSSFEASDLQNLTVGNAICRIERSDHDFNLQTEPVSVMDESLIESRTNAVVESSRRQYGRHVTPSAPHQTEVPPPFPIVKPVPSGPPAETAPQTPAPRPNAPVLDPAATEPVSVKASSPGRGGTQHKYLQQLIKRWGEANGFRVCVERQILDGLGAVDVSLEHGDYSVACEISMTTAAKHEMGNIQKCLAAGFRDVVVIATDTKQLSRLSKRAEDLEPGVLERVHFLSPDDLFTFLAARIPRPESRETTVRGYRVKIRVQDTSTEVQASKQQSIATTMLRAARRVKAERQQKIKSGTSEPDE